MLERAQKYGLGTTWAVFVSFNDTTIQVLPQFGSTNASDGPILNCQLDPRLLRRILDRNANWNSAEIGCHIDFFRTPNVYEPDLHTMLQFLHL